MHNFNFLLVSLFCLSSLAVPTRRNIHLRQNSLNEIELNASEYRTETVNVSRILADVHPLCDLAESMSISDTYPEWTCRNISKVCSWRGVTCDAQRNIVAVTLISIPVPTTATIPSSIGMLSLLSTLQLWKMGIGSTIPSSIGNLVNLSILLLYELNLHGTIPSTICKLTQVYQLIVGNNHLTSSLPSCIGNLQSLEELDVGINSLTTTLPTSIGLLSRLHSCSIQSNQFSGQLPSQFGILSNLDYFYGANNKFTSSLPTFLFELTKLVTLDLSVNKFTSSIPSTVSKLTSLTQLRFDTNKLISSLPSTLGYCTKLLTIRLSFNKLTGSVPSSLGKLKLITYLHLARNKLTSTIPKEISGALSMRRFFLYGNNMWGSIPMSFGNLSSLQYTDLSQNQFSSTIPETCCKLTKLQHVGFENNCLRGTIPSCFGSLSSVTYIYLANNHFTSSIPSSLGLVAKYLSTLDLSNNSLTSTIPTSLGYLTNLNTISLQQNQLTGPIPSSLGRLTKLFFLDLSSNSLSSTVPTAMLSLTKMRSIYLHDNRLTGEFPTSICKLPVLFELELGNNNLSCSPLCRTDVDWKKDAGFHRCIDDQDRALFDLDSSMEIAKSLSKVVITSTIVIESSHPFDESSSVTFISEQNAFEYQISMNPTASFCSFDRIYFCFDALCRNQFAWYRVTGPNTFQGTTFPITVNSDFYIVVSADMNNCSPVFYGYGVTIVVRSHPVRSWNFDTLPYPSVVSQSVPSSPYATGLCQKEWAGVTCDKGIVRSISLKGYGLTGTLPSSINLLYGLTSLDLSFNDIAGTITPSLGLLTGLDTLVLSNNKLAGTLPRTFTNSTLYLVSLAYNNLNGSVPVIFTQDSRMRFLFLDGNSYRGEIPSALCNAVVNNNLTITLTNVPRLTCYQKNCWESTSPSQRTFDSSVYMCSPTHSPTWMPSSVPTFMPIENTKQEISRDVVIGVSVPGSAIVFFILCWLIYRFRFSKKAQTKREISYRLRQLPVHRLLRRGSSSPQPNLNHLIIEHIQTVNQKDYNQMTALDIILSGQHRIPVSAETICALLMVSLPVDPTSGNPVDPSIHNYAWAKAVQQNHDYVVDAVKMVLQNCRPYVQILANSPDESGRISKDIASSGCKEAIFRRLYLFEKYELKEGPPEHKSATSLVIIANQYDFDQGRSVRQVALKFMRHKGHFDREVKTREKGAFDEKFVLPIIAKYDSELDSQDEKSFREDAIAKGYKDYPFCVVMEAANLHLKRIIDQQHIVGREWDDIRQIIKQLASCLKHMHEKGFIHGDVKPLNILQVQNVYKLIDLDASACLNDDYLGNKYSSAYIPPEFICIKSDGKPAIKSFGTNTEGVDPLKVSVSFDMWSLGCVLYLLCTGTTLFQGTSDGDNVYYEEDLVTLSEWTSDTKEKRLSGVTDRFAMNLLSLLLNKEPEKRLDASRVLSHPFITKNPESQPIRLQSEAPKWDFFISYRSLADEFIANQLYDSLTRRGLKVWMDVKNQKGGQDWEVEFCNAIVNSAFVICIISRNGVKNDQDTLRNIESFRPDSCQDNLLLEWMLALELKERNYLNGIFPVFVGDYVDGIYSNFKTTCCTPNPPDIVVDSLNSKLALRLDCMNLGTPYRRDLTVRATYEGITSSQGGYWVGDPRSALTSVMNEIMKTKQPNTEKYKSPKNDQTVLSQIQATLRRVQTENETLKTENKRLQSKCRKLSSRCTCCEETKGTDGNTIDQVDSAEDVSLVETSNRQMNGMSNGLGMI